MLNMDAVIDARDKAERAAPPVRIIYSSRTGNTRTVAEHLSLRFGISAVNAKEELAARKAEAEVGLPRQGDAAGADSDILLLGMWAWRGGPNPTMRTFMRGLRGRRVFLFGTMAAWPDSPHAQDCLNCARTLLDEGGNSLAGHFFCQGRLDPRLMGKGHHPLTPERMKRLEEAAHHPDMADLLKAEAAARAALHGLGILPVNLHVFQAMLNA
ncbi:flavodoxin family protein [Mailhella sp.]|uniref:flavodoxin family protein n=1 Tax=Mailhella sp. TaxID=1981029 RepID=UPI00406486C7